MLFGTIEDFIKKHISFIEATGFFSETVVFIIVVCLLFRNHYLVAVFAVGVFCSSIINGVLKSALKDPRPKNPIKFLASDHFINKKTMYGMPSNHTQTLFFSITFLYLACSTCGPWTFLCFFIALTAVYERYAFHNHTALQLVAGAILGTMLGATAYTASTHIK